MSEHITPERIAEIKARCEAATEGPWVVEDWGDETYPSPSIVAPPSTCIPPRGYPCEDLGNRIIYDEDGDCSDDDINFIAHARADVPDLLAALEASERKVAELEEANRVLSSAERKG
jgi:hypothetical protein